MTGPEYCLVLCAIDDLARADAIGTAAVTKRLAAAVNILPGIDSIFRWKGKVERARESMMVFYTRRTLSDALTTHIRANHPYELPAVITVDITGGLPACLEWISGNTAATVDEY